MRISLEKACQELEDGHVVAIPTETVYGLAAKLLCSEAIEMIFQMKGRPRKNPLITHIASLSQVDHYLTAIPPDLDLLTQAFWPGAMTVILPIDQFPQGVCAGLQTAAFRMPNHPLTLALLEKVGPVVAPSANLSGRPSATCAEHAEADFGSDLPVLDGGPCKQGLESTILIYIEPQWQIARLGAIPPEAFTPVLGYEPKVSVKRKEPICPGQLYRHYAPKADLHLGIENIPNTTETAIIGFDEREYPAHCRLYRFGPLLDPEKVAENFYATLRQLDRDHIKSAWVDIHFPETDVWITLRERLIVASQNRG